MSNINDKLKAILTEIYQQEITDFIVLAVSESKIHTATEIDYVFGVGVLEKTKFDMLRRHEENL